MYILANLKQSKLLIYLNNLPLFEREKGHLQTNSSCSQETKGGVLEVHNYW